MNKLNMQRTDADIARAALQALRSDEVVPNNKVKVVVNDGRLTIKGELDWQYQRLSAEKTVRSLRGMKHLVNAITLKHCSAPSDVKAKIEFALKRSAEADARHITVETQNGTAILRGTVHSLAARDEAELAAWAAPGITWVEDHITIKPNFASL
jgi:osmotically-inducible protein OsmY